MAEDENKTPQDILSSIEWVNVPLPSDRLTLGQLREATAYDPEAMEVALRNLSTIEMEVVRDAMSEVLGIGGAVGVRVTGALMEEKARKLAALYASSGLARGIHEAAALTKELETWAANEAQRYVHDRPR